MNCGIDRWKEGWKEGKNEGLPAKHSITCWVYNWWEGKSRALCLLQIHCVCTAVRSHHLILLGGLYVSLVGARHMDIKLH